MEIVIVRLLCSASQLHSIFSTLTKMKSAREENWVM